MKKLSFYASIMGVALTACVSNGNHGNETTEVVIRESDMQATTPSATIVVSDTVEARPFYKLATYQKPDDNGGYEEYRLVMNLYEATIPDDNGSMTHGRLTLYVKTPENTEGIKVAQRTIERVTRLDEATAEIEMSGTGEKPIHFNGTITYDTVAHTYQLTMAAPALLEDLMENNMTLE